MITGSVPDTDTMVTLSTEGCEDVYIASGSNQDSFLAEAYRNQTNDPLDSSNIRAKLKSLK